MYTHSYLWLSTRSCLVGSLTCLLLYLNFLNYHSFLTSVHSVLFILLFLLQCQLPFLGLVRILPDKQTAEAFTSSLRPSHRLTNGHSGDHGATNSNGGSFLTPCNSALNTHAARSVDSQFNLKADLHVLCLPHRKEKSRESEILIFTMIKVFFSKKVKFNRSKPGFIQYYYFRMLSAGRFPQYEPSSAQEAVFPATYHWLWVSVKLLETIMIVTDAR